MKLRLASIFLMSVLLAGAIAPTLNGYQILDYVFQKPFVENAFAQTDETNTENTDGTQLENLGQAVSTFVHESRDEFRAQKEETRAIIKQCREALDRAAPEEIEDIKKQCREHLDQIKESYQQLRRTYHDVFKEFRTEVKTIIQDPSNTGVIRTLDSLMQQDEVKQRIHDLRIQMQEELNGEIKDLREQMKKERETIREEIKKMTDERVDRTKIKEQLDSMREKMKQEQAKIKEMRQKIKDQMKEEHEKMKEETKTENEKIKADSDEMKKKLEDELEKIKQAREEAKG